MASTATKWILGCGAAGCLVIVLGVALLIGGGAWLVRDTVAPFERAVETRELLDEQFGEADSYTPPAGEIPADRMELFLAVREASQPARTAIADFFAAIPMTEEQARELESQPAFDQIKSAFKITSSAFGLGSGIGELFAERNQALLDSGMGMGEYTYIYAVSYWAWLRNDPSESPDNLADSESSGKVQIEIGDSMSGGSLRRVRRELREMLENQLAAAAELPEAEDWRGRLQAEIEALQSDRSRLPWQDDLPASIAASLEPYRERLEATYSPFTNPFELARNVKQGSMSYTVE